MPDLPTGTVTFLFTDIEGSAQLWERAPAAMRSVPARHDALLREAIEANGGVVFKTIGDAFCAVFASASQAVSAALAAQCVLSAEPWEANLPVRVRMALHTGEAEHRDDDYFGPTLNRTARLLAVGHGGQVLLSERAREWTGSALPAGANLHDRGSHRLKDLQQPEHIFQLLHPDLPAEFSPLKSLQHAVTNLPIQPTTFVGRAKEIADGKALLAETRLLTLTGIGGVGKTRLALQIAADVLETYRDGVWLVELAALSDPALVPQAVASVLNVREEPGRSLTQSLTEHLASRQALLLLDNCEHLLTACARFADAVLRACPDVKILAGSRERLGIAGETAYALPSLSLPDATEQETPEAALRCETVQLFQDRAVAVAPAFAVTPANVRALAQVCRRLDGIPLAIELAAARVRVLPVEQIAARLDDRFRLLTGGSRTALPRQQTLRALIDWSYELLTEEERLLLRRLSVFAGGWTLEAAETVCTSKEEGGRMKDEENQALLHPYDVLDLLTSLTDKSLVLYEEREEEARFRLLETMREYARDRLREAGETEAIRDRHRDWAAALVKEAHAQMDGPDGPASVRQLEVEHDNVRAALTWCLDAGADAETPAIGLEMAAGMVRFWDTRGYLREGRAFIEALLAQAETRVENQAPVARALTGAGNLALSQGDDDAARSFYERSLPLKRALNDRRGIAVTLTNLGNVAFCRKDNAAAHVFFDEALTLRREVEDKPGIAVAMIWLGLLANEEGERETAKSWFLESLALYRELGERDNISYALDNLGDLVCAEGDIAAARAYYVEALQIRLDLGDQRGIAGILESFALLAVQTNLPAQAARFLGAAEVLHEAVGAPPKANEREDAERYAAAACAALGEEAYAAAWKEGRALTPEQAVELAQKEAAET